MTFLRPLALALVLVPCSAALAGCGSDQTQTNTPVASASASGTPSAAPTTSDSAGPTTTAAPTTSAVASGAPSAQPAAPPHWTYTGAEGPAKWGDLSPEYATCKTGKNQSPIDIDTKKAGVDKDLKLIDFSYAAPIPLQIFNNGHTVQVANSTPASMKARGETWKLVQFHFHSPSEHTIDGKGTDLELHLVHSNESGELSVVGLLFKKGKDNKLLAPVFDNTPAEVTKEPKAVEKVSVDLAKVIPPKAKYYTYTGSLTTPTCKEGVRWYVLDSIGEVSDAQLQKFRAATKTDTNRPVMPLGDRKVMRPN